MANDFTIRSAAGAVLSRTHGFPWESDIFDAVEDHGDVTIHDETNDGTLVAFARDGGPVVLVNGCECGGRCGDAPACEAPPEVMYDGKPLCYPCYAEIKHRARG